MELFPVGKEQIYCRLQWKIQGRRERKQDSRKAGRATDNSVILLHRASYEVFSAFIILLSILLLSAMLALVHSFPIQTLL